MLSARDTSQLKLSLDNLCSSSSPLQLDGKAFDVICLQELQRCVKPNCKHCHQGKCQNNHADFAQKYMSRHGYSGDYHKEGKRNSVGLYFKHSSFILVGAKLHYCPFRSFKGAVLALLRRCRSPSLSTANPQDGLVLIVALHLSVPLGPSGRPSTDLPLEEIKQLNMKIQEIYRRNGGKPIPTGRYSRYRHFATCVYIFWVN